jgi:hypothetical protein
MNNFLENNDIKELLGSFTNISDFGDIFRILKNKDNIINIASLIFSDYLNNEMQNKSFTKILNSILRETLIMHLYFKREEIINNTNKGCLELLNYTLLGNLNYDIKEKRHNNSYEYNESLSDYYLQKLVYDSTKNKNDILKYEDCIIFKFSSFTKQIK